MGRFPLTLVVTTVSCVLHSRNGSDVPKSAPMSYPTRRGEHAGTANTIFFNVKVNLRCGSVFDYLLAI
jgi:hypothetical protein